MLGPLPPYVQLQSFLPGHELGRLLEWTLSNEHRFKPAKVTRMRDDTVRSVLDPDYRIAAILSDLGPCEPAIREHLLGALPSLMEATGTPGPQPESLNLQIAAHGDGAHYRAHLDIPVGPGRQPLGPREGEDRILSAVLYFHVEPQAFSGGQLRLHAFGAGRSPDDAPEHYVDLEPLQNSLAAFPSWARHEVRKVSCPGDRFRDYRFALNCWYCRKL
jgi:Rps23 Pro-64 3,4-dihydroxylase Tpa1-like proline 4-hydroxylase